MSEYHHFVVAAPATLDGARPDDVELHPTAELLAASEGDDGR